MNRHSRGGLCGLRILVAIASYGEKNLKFLRKVIQTYRSMPFDIDVVVLSEAPKDLAAGVENVVGLPSRNPWTLPFAHKPIFCDRVNLYDLFVYSEDDIGVTEANIGAFLRATPKLMPDEIAGFFRYELDASRKIFVTEPWKHYHWKPESVRRRSEYTIAEFTNEHTGLYILTQKQLKRAIASRGFLREPYRGRYDWPETAATDPYTSCGFSKVICISHLDDFLVHHLPNPYVHKLDVTLAEFKQQIEILERIDRREHPASTLCPVESPHWPRAWQKSYYERPSTDLFDIVPAHTETLLSVGCGWGATETELMKLGVRVTAFPLDSVIGAVAEHKGIEIVYGNLEECFNTIAHRKFSCVLVTNLLHLLADPDQIVKQCAWHVENGGTLVVAGPNFDRLPWRLKQYLGLDGFYKLRSFERSGFSRCSPGRLQNSIKQAGFQIKHVQWVNHTIESRFSPVRRVNFGSLTAREWVFQARRQAPL